MPWSRLACAISSTSVFAERSRNLCPWWSGTTQKSQLYGQPRLVSISTYGSLTSGSR